MEPQAKSGMSKKAFGAGIAITAIVGTVNDVPKLIAIVVVSSVAIIAQGILDWKKG